MTLEREDKMKSKEFIVYEIFAERNVRRVKKEGEEADAFDVDQEGRVVAYSNDQGEIVMQSLRIPDSLHKHIRPRYNLALHKENPAKIAQQRMTYIEKITSSIRIFEAI